MEMEMGVLRMVLEHIDRPDLSKGLTRDVTDIHTQYEFLSVVNAARPGEGVATRDRSEPTRDKRRGYYSRHSRPDPRIPRTLP